MDCGHYSGADLHVFLPLSGGHSKSIEGRKWSAHLYNSIVTQYFILLIKFGLWTSVLHSMWLSVYIIASSGFHHLLSILWCTTCMGAHKCYVLTN